MWCNIIKIWLTHDINYTFSLFSDWMLSWEIDGVLFVPECVLGLLELNINSLWNWSTDPYRAAYIKHISNNN